MPVGCTWLRGIGRIYRAHSRRAGSVVDRRLSREKMQTHSTPIVPESWGNSSLAHPDVIRPHHESLSKEFSFSSLKCFDFTTYTENIMCQISIQDLPQNNLSEIQPLPSCNCWWILIQRSGRTGGNSVQEPTGTVRRKRLAFGVPKDAATKTT